MRAVPKSLSLAVVLAAVGLSAACSSSVSTSPSTTGASPASPSAAVLDAANASVKQGSADMHLQMTATVAGKNVAITGNGTVDTADNSMQMVMSIQGLPTVGGSSISMLLVNGTTYVSYPGISSVLPGKSWISQPSTSSSTAGTQVTNVSDMLRMLSAKGAVVTKVGGGTVGTTPVTEYTVNVTSSMFASQGSALGIPSSESAAVQQILGSDGLQFHVFLTSTNQLRRISMQMSMPSTGSSTATGGQASIVVDLTNYGAAAPVTAPPASQVATLEQFTAASAGGTQ